MFLTIIFSSFCRPRRALSLPTSCLHPAVTPTQQAPTSLSLSPVMPSRSRISLASMMTTSSSHHVPTKHRPAENTGVTTTRVASPAQDDDDDEELPRPVQATDYPDGRRKKKARISLGLHVRWDRFLRKLGSGTAPSTSSALDDSSGDSTGYNRSRARREAVVDEGDEVDEVVVDREWSGEIKSSVHSEHGGTPEKSHGSDPRLGHGGTSTDRDSVAIHADGCWASNTLLIWLRYRIWPTAYNFFCTRFLDEKSENHYKKESWFFRKVCHSRFALISTALMLTPRLVAGALGLGILHRQLGPCGRLYSTSSRPCRYDLLLWCTTTCSL